MLYKIDGTVRTVFPIQSGTSNSGNVWKKRAIIIDVTEKKWNSSLRKEVDVEVPKYVTCWGKDADTITEKVTGQKCTCSLKVESREYNNRWSTDLTLNKISFPEMFNDERPEIETEFPLSADTPDDDLPF